MKLNRTIDRIRSEYSTNNKRNLQKALKNRLEIKKINIENYINLRQVSDKSKFNTKHYQKLIKLFTGIIKRDNGELTGAYFNDKLCAAVLWVYSETRLIYLNAVSSDAGKEKRAMFLMVDDCIERNAGKEAIIDFEGSMIPGVARFFQGFGSKENNYMRIRKSKIPFTLKDNK